MITSANRYLGIGLLFTLTSIHVAAQNETASEQKTGLMAEIQAALAAEDNALTEQDLRQKLAFLTSQRSKLIDYMRSRDTEMRKLRESLANAQNKTPEKDALMAERDQLKADLTTNEAKLVQIRQELETSEGDDVKKLNNDLVQLQQRRTAIKARLNEVETELAGIKTNNTYTVQPGDSLSSIAQTHYGDAKRWKDIFEANRSAIENPNVIAAGMVLTLP